MDDERHLVTVRDFDEVLGTYLLRLLAEVPAESDDEDEFDEGACVSRTGTTPTRSPARH